MKVIAIIIAYISILVFIIVDIEITLIRKPFQEEAVHRYFLCEAVGPVMGQCSRESVESYANPFLDSMYYFVLMLISIICLILIINC